MVLVLGKPSGSPHKVHFQQVKAEFQRWASLPLNWWSAHVRFGYTIEMAGTNLLAAGKSSHPEDFTCMSSGQILQISNAIP